MSRHATFDNLESENEDLRARLEAAEETLRAIRAHEVDALVVGTSGTERVCTIGGADECYRTFVESMRQGAVTLSRDGAILYCNRYFAELVRTPLDQTLGQSIYHFAAPEDEGLLRATLWEGMSSTMVKRQLSLRRSDGLKVHVALLATHSGVDDSTNCCVLLVTDLTEHEARVAAEAASAAKDRFLALLSHELRTPLTPALLAVIEMEGNDALSADVRESLALVRRSIELETRLIDDLLDLSRAINGKLNLRRQLVDLHRILQSVVETVGAELRQRRLKLQCAGSSEPILLKADAARLQQVFWNLLKNAAKFSSDGKEIEIRCRDGGDGFAIIEVADQGIGIDPAVLPSIFEPFEQGNLGQAAGGLGLGLAIAKAVVEAHGGTISARSEGSGKGSTFVVSLPIASPEQQAPATPTSVQPAVTRPLRVLLVEDHRDTANAMARLLQLSGHQINIANDVSTAFALASTQPFDLLISDIGLPDGTGYQLMRDIRQKQAIPGIALSGYGMEADLKATSDAGFMEHIVKPVDPAQLHEVIARVVSKK